MNAKTYLKQIHVLDLKINQRIREAQELQEKALSVGCISNDDKVQSTPSGDGLVNKVAAYVDMEAEINRMVDELVDLKHEIITQIHMLRDERYIDILYRRYVCYEKMEEIARGLHYDRVHVCRLHGQALKEFEEKVLEVT